MRPSFRDILNDLEALNENVTNQELASAFSDKPNASQALRVFNLLKTHTPEQLSNDDRMEATKILKFLLPEISVNDVFDKIKNTEHDEEQQQIKQTTAPQQQQAQQPNNQAQPQPPGPNNSNNAS